MNYPRKRAPLACNFCRHRKRRCDGKKPSCGHCEDSEIECQYQGSNTHAHENDTQGSSEMSESLNQRLERIEKALKHQSEKIVSIPEDCSGPKSVSSVGQSPATDRLHNPEALTSAANTSQTSMRGAAISPPATLWHSVTQTLDSYSPSGSLGSEFPPLTIPLGHHTSTSSLLSLPQMKNLVGDFPDDTFLLIESQRPTPEQLSPAMGSCGQCTFPALDREYTDHLVANFFAVFHPSHPILDPNMFAVVYESVFRDGLQESLQSALVLVILALGAVALGPVRAHNDNSDDEWLPGAEYFHPALRILASNWTSSAQLNVSLTEGLIFGSIYLCAIVRPLQAWKLVNMASTAVQMQYTCHGKKNSHPQREQIIRACWACFDLECDVLAELQVPRSGIDLLVDEMVYPDWGDTPNREQHFYLAELSARRLLNRVHNSVYNSTQAQGPGISPVAPSAVVASSAKSPSNLPINSLLSICLELDRQLDAWYETLPELIKPDLSVANCGDQILQQLQLRYWSCKHIISRPFLLFATSLGEDDDLPAIILRYAQTCLTSCRTYLYTVQNMLKSPSPYTWTVIQSSLAAILVLTIASLCPSLKHMVTDINYLQRMTINSTREWSSPDSSVESVIWIIMGIRKKQQISASKLDMM